MRVHATTSGALQAAPADDFTALDLERPPFYYIFLALLCAVLAGLVLSSDYGLAVRIPLTVIAIAAMLAAVVMHLRVTRRAEAHHLEAFEAKLRDSEERLRQAQKMEAVGQLAGGIAHDFNNLVTVIGCSVGLLSETIDPQDPSQEDLEQIKEAADRAATLTRQLLAFSRRQILQPRPLALNTVVHDMEKMLQRVLGPHITIQESLDPSLGQVLADVGQIEQVIMNLAVNARDAMPNGGTLSFITEDRSITRPKEHQHGVIPQGEYVTLIIRDSGQGMPEQILEHAFEPFFTTKEQGKGTGLGLATVHGIVYQSGGHIMADSTPGLGTEFTMFFPRIRGSERIATPHAGVPMVAPNEEPRRSILVVDDEDAIRDIAGRILQQAGFRVFIAKHGEQAVEILTQEQRAGTPISLVLTDVVMPVMGGRELADIVVSEYLETRVLCMSGYTRDELMRQYFVQDELPIVHKPFEVQELIRAVRKTLDDPIEAHSTAS